MNTPIKCIVTFAGKILENNSKKYEYANMVTQSARMLKFLWQSIIDTRLIEKNLLKLNLILESLQNAIVPIKEVMSFNVQSKNIRL